jgi:hypothetical protein
MVKLTVANNLDVLMKKRFTSDPSSLAKRNRLQKVQERNMSNLLFGYNNCSQTEWRVKTGYFRIRKCSYTTARSSIDCSTIDRLRTVVLSVAGFGNFCPVGFPFGLYLLVVYDYPSNPHEDDLKRLHICSTLYKRTSVALKETRCVWFNVFERIYTMR